MRFTNDQEAREYARSRAEFAYGSAMLKDDRPTYEALKTHAGECGFITAVNYGLSKRAALSAVRSAASRFEHWRSSGAGWNGIAFL